jgi:hypothetical protein
MYIIGRERGRGREKGEGEKRKEAEGMREGKCDLPTPLCA